MSHLLCSPMDMDLATSFWLSMTEGVRKSPLVTGMLSASSPMSVGSL